MVMYGIEDLWRVNLNRKGKGMIKGIKIVGVMLIIGLLILIKVALADNLFLTGVVRSIDQKKGIIRVAVSSESCRGLREFTVPEDSRTDLDSSLIGKRIEFFINSDKCEQGRIYTILGGQK